MKKKIAILGSTGSIGTTTLNLIDQFKNDYKVELLSTNRNIKKILEQSTKFKVKNIIIHDKMYFTKNLDLFKKYKLNTFNSVEDYSKKIKTKLDYTMSSISGLDGLSSTLKFIKLTKTIAIANKESIICGWNLIEKKLKKYKTKFIPIDSEHYSIFELLKENEYKDIKKIYITASGGPFLNFKYSKIKNSSSNIAIKHPTWKMGKKISIDSSTLMNKVFELIEAKKIFNIDNHIFEIIIQPTSYVHSIIEFKFGVTKILTHPTSMEVPIYNSLNLKNKKINFFEDLDFSKLNNLKFQKVDNFRFPIKKIIEKIPDTHSLFETVLVSANDTLVELYLQNKIKFYDIFKNLNKILDLKEFEKLKKIKPKNLEQILNLSNKVRLKTQSLSVISSF